ncbi:homoserine kinase [Miniphocaeibacter massiliensis]|uniref:homoserine kinase n=1 Tax=Miniphocaeibacter massiliensis TaxID=2041841 RepID=UPI000C1C42B9|nr:homoserine kinase [Miniphocaeibacter massiliensis]
MLKISVPASSANLGPGFDVLALSFKLYNIFTFEKNDKLEIISDFEEYNNENNLVYKTMKQVFEEFGKTPSPLKINVGSDIPLSRGLGSSATCILAGVIAANYYLGNKMTNYDIYKKAIEIEGHCDNITSQFYGGLSMSLKENGEVYYKKMNVPKGMKCTALIPDFTLETKIAREVLPKEVTMQDAVFNLSHCLLMLNALENSNFKDLKLFFKDKLHQDYRAPLVNNFHEIVNKAYELGAYASFLSGAGPTIMVFRDENDKEFNDKIRLYLDTLKDKWTIVDLEIDNDGTIIEVI